MILLGPRVARPVRETADCVRTAPRASLPNPRARQVLAIAARGGTRTAPFRALETATMQQLTFRGISLVELMTIVAIMGILAALPMPVLH